MAEIDAARVGNHRDAHAAVFGRLRGHLFEKGYPGFTQRFGVGHNMRLGNRHEIGRVEKTPDLHHVFHRPATRLAHFAIAHGLFFVA